MIRKVNIYISKHNLLDYEKSVLVALSGGADSVALLAILLRLGYRCEAVHCNFHLRGDESNRDEMFVRTLCRQKEVTLHVIDFDTARYAKEKGISIEMAAREQRYEAFERLRKDINAGAIAVAHHMDDSAETVLLNLVRGTGIKGLRGIQPKNGYIVRPLLCVGRKDIIDYLKQHKEDFVTDSTNQTSDYTRNKIRLEILPRLAEINPSVKESIATTAWRINEAELIYRNAIEDAIRRVKDGNSVDIAQLKREIAPATLLHEILSPIGFNSAQVESIMASIDNEGVKIFHSTNWMVIKERTALIIREREKTEEQANVILPTEGTIRTTKGSLRITIHAFDGNIPRKHNIATLDTGKLKFPLTLRKVQNGDRFSPFGMRGTKLVSDYLTDRKKEFIEKMEQLVITDASGEIVWIVDERPSSRCSVCGKTKEVICLEWNPAKKKSN